MNSRPLLPSFLGLTALALVACGGKGSEPLGNPPSAAPNALATPQKHETAKVEVPKVEAPKVEAPKVEPPKVETPKVEAPKVEAPKPSGDKAIDTMRAFIAGLKIDKTDAGWKTKVTMPPKLTFEAGHKYFWLLETTEGTIKVRLMPDVAPMHVSSTIYLTELGFYDDILFHRVIPGFMAQGGDPLGKGIGGPGYKYAGEFSPTAKHSKPGILSMANAGPNTDGSQFFLTFVETPHLDGLHTVFGEVVDGMDTVKKLETFGSQSGATRKPLKIVKAKIATE